MLRVSFKEHGKTFPLERVLCHLLLTGGFPNYILVSLTNTEDVFVTVMLFKFISFAFHQAPVIKNKKKREKKKKEKVT